MVGERNGADEEAAVVGALLRSSRMSGCSGCWDGNGMGWRVGWSSRESCRIQGRHIQNYHTQLHPFPSCYPIECSYFERAMEWEERDGFWGGVLQGWQQMFHVWPPLQVGSCLGWHRRQFLRLIGGNPFSVEVVSDEPTSKS